MFMPTVVGSHACLGVPFGHVHTPASAEEARTQDTAHRIVHGMFMFAIVVHAPLRVYRFEGDAVIIIRGLGVKPKIGNSFVEFKLK